MLERSSGRLLFVWWQSSSWSTSLSGRASKVPARYDLKKPYLDNLLSFLYRSKSQYRKVRLNTRHQANLYLNSTSSSAICATFSTGFPAKKRVGVTVLVLRCLLDLASAYLVKLCRLLYSPTHTRDLCSRRSAEQDLLCVILASVPFVLYCISPFL